MDRSLSPAVSAALLALTVTVCTGSLADGATARLLFAGDAQPRAVADANGDRTPTLLSCLSEVARQFCTSHDQVAVARLTGPVNPTLGLGSTAHWQAIEALNQPRPQPPVHLSLLNLPPPTLC